MGCRMGKTTNSKTTVKDDSSSSPQLDIAVLPSLNRRQLQSHCKKLGLKAGGKNTELVERLQNHLVQAHEGQSLLLDSNNNPCSSLEEQETEPLHKESSEGIKKASKTKAKNARKNKKASRTVKSTPTEKDTSTEKHTVGHEKMTCGSLPETSSNVIKPDDILDLQSKNEDLLDQNQNSEISDAKDFKTKTRRQRKGQPRKKRAHFAAEKEEFDSVANENVNQNSINQTEGSGKDQRQKRRRKVYAVESETVQETCSESKYTDTELTLIAQQTSNRIQHQDNNQDNNNGLEVNDISAVSNGNVSSSCIVAENEIMDSDAHSSKLAAEHCTSTADNEITSGSVQDACVNSHQEQSSQEVSSLYKEPLNRTFTLPSNTDEDTVKGGDISCDQVTQGPVTSSQPIPTSPLSHWCVADGLMKQGSDLAWKRIRLKGGRPVVPNRFGKYIAFSLTPSHLSVPDGFPDNYICEDCVKLNERLHHETETCSRPLPQQVMPQQGKENTPLSRDNIRASVKRKRDEGHGKADEADGSNGGSEPQELSMMKKRRRSGVVSKSGGTPASPCVRKERGEKLLPRNHTKPWQPKKRSSLVQEDTTFARKIEDIIRKTVPGSEEELNLIMGSRRGGLARSPPRT